VRAYQEIPYKEISFRQLNIRCAYHVSHVHGFLSYIPDNNTFGQQGNFYIIENRHQCHR
jgi:hypothetical protein